jgi:ADP-heptose:LPS heptosyltransferase
VDEFGPPIKILADTPVLKMKKIIVISATGMGDSLWGTPGIRALKNTFPEVQIDLVVKKSWKPLFQFNPHLNKIFEYQENWYSQPFLIAQLFNKKYDAILIFHANRNFKRVLPWLRSSPVWYHQNFDWIPESHHVKIDTHVHGIQRRLILLEKVGVSSDGGQMEIYFDEDTVGKAQKLLHTHGFNIKEYVYLNLGAAVESRRWKVDRFTSLAQQILDETSWNIIIGGGPNEKLRAHSILNQLNSSRVMEVCDQPILLNAYIISKARLMITADTGPMHIGFALKTPIVALFGTISAVGSGPHEIPENLYRIIEVDQENSVSTEKHGADDFLFSRITVDRVWGQVKNLLAEISEP